MDNEKEKANKAYRDAMNGSVASFAPGRIEFLGNHLDYNGGLVLGAAIDVGIYALATPSEGDGIRLFSESFEDAIVECSLDGFCRQEGKTSWANYCLGVLKVMQEVGLAPRTGFSLTFTTDLPVSVGLSSSAALELATAIALAQLAGHRLGHKELVGICRKAENEFVGVPCGILDQATSAFGRKDHLVSIDCEKEDFSTLPLPPHSKLWIFDSGIKHDLVDSHYAKRHGECLAALGSLQENGQEITCLAKAQEESIEQASMPENVSKRARHIVGEQKRVLSFREGLASHKSIREMGLLLNDSHESSSLLFENSCPEVDFLASKLQAHPEVLGARLTGGGFGGAVLAWTATGFGPIDADAIAKEHENEFDHLPSVHSFAPSNGARVEPWPG
jgi:galactokinase